MHEQVVVRQDNQTEWRVELAHEAPMEAAQARAWLDEQFIALECEPLRPSGKLLLADKVLAVAGAAGRQLDDPVWSKQFARAVLAALARPFVHIDLATLTVSY